MADEDCLNEICDFMVRGVGFMEETIYFSNGKKQKRLMLLGGNRYQLPVIKAAHELGYYVITCDYLPDNYAHQFSDEYCNVSIIDKEAVLEAAIKLKIDGIMSFACDPGVTVAAYVAEQLGLPSVGSYEAVSILQNKGRFRKFLAEHGFHVPMAKVYTEAKAALEDAGKFRWPVIVKPTDSAGSKGVRRVDKQEKLEGAIAYALEHSFKKEFIVEEFLEKVGCSSSTDIFSVNGELKFISFDAQHFDAEAMNPYTPAAHSWPSTMTEEHKKELEGELQRLINLLKLKSSIYNIETMECTDGKAYIMEFTPRGGGNRLAEMLRYMTGVDLIKASVLTAVGEAVTEVVQRQCNGYWAEVILHSYKSGIFKELWVSQEIQENVVETDLWIKEGDCVGEFKAASNSFGTVVLHFTNESEMMKVLNNIKKYIKVQLMTNDCTR